jgi:hypothetical protein
MASKKAGGPKESEKVLACGIEQDPERYLYYVDRRGNLVRMERGVARAKTEVILEKAVKREKGFMYFLDADGDLCKAKDSGR